MIPIKKVTLIFDAVVTSMSDVLN